MEITGNRHGNSIRHCSVIFAAIVIIAMMFSPLLIIDNAEAHIDEGVGDPRQLYSYFDSDASTAINLDGAIARGGSPSDEWDGGYAREINITNGSNSRFCYLLFANDDNYLYIGVIYDSPNAASSNGVELYFDEGVEPGRYDGSHNDFLDPDKENYIEVRGNQPANRDFHDGYYDDVLGWTRDNASDTPAQDAWDDFDFNVDKGGNYFNWEFQIPLDPQEDTAGGPSDLNVAGTDELGFYFRVWDAGDNTWYYWDMTGPDPNDVNVYADLRLGIETKRDLTIYATFANTGLPTIDGDLSGDFAWANAYEREMVLTNFKRETIQSKLYACEDPNQGYIYIGMVVYDDETTSGDYLRLYFEEGSSGGPFGPRNGILSSNFELEHYQEISSDGTFIDGHFNPSDPGTWETDTGVGEDNDGDASLLYKNEVGTLNDRYEFEFLIPYTPLGSWPLVDGDNDLWITSTDLIGFLIRYHDESQAVGEQDFWWDFTTNLDKIQTQETAGGVYSAIGWAYLQTGAPALKPITPINGGTVWGASYIFRVEAEDESPDGFDGIVFAGFQMEGETSWISLARESTTSGIWYTYWDTTAYPDGTYNVTVVAQDNEGIIVKKIITISIANGGGAMAPPTITITQPAKESNVSGTVEYRATTTGIVTAVEFYVDDQLIGKMSNIGTDTWRYNLVTTYWNDGMHIIKAVAKNAVGEGGDAGIYTFENFSPNPPEIVSVLEGQYIGGIFTFRVQSGDTDLAGIDLTVINNDLSIEVVSNVTLGLNTGTGYYEYTLDTNALDDGNFTVVAYARDSANNIASSSPVNFKIDNNAPDLAVSYPTDNSVVRNIVSFVYTVDDPFIQDVMYKIDSNPWIDINVAWNTSNFDDDSHSLKIRARDYSGHETMETLTIIVDNNDPTIYIVNPLPNQFIEDVYTIKVMADDEVGIDEVRITIENLDDVSIIINDMPIGYNTGTGYYEYTLDTTIIDDGNYSILAISYDESGLDSGANTLNFQIDNTPPDLTLVSPKNNAFVSGDVVFDVLVEDTFYRDTMYNVDGTSGWINMSTAFNTTEFADGVHTIQIRARDLSYHEIIDQITLNIDNNAPTIGINSPVSGQFFEGVSTFQIIANDKVGIEEVRITITNTDSATVVINDIPIGYNSGTGYYEYTLYTSILEDGNYSLSCISYDLSGQDSGTLSVGFKIDNNIPQLTVVSPLDGELLTGTVTIEAEAEDVFLSTLTWRVDGSGWIDISDPWNTGYFEDGTHTLEVRAKDMADHEATQIIKVRTDNNAPSLYIVSMPKNDEHVGGTFFIQVEVKDMLDIKEVSYKVDDLASERMFLNKATGFYEVKIVTDSSGLGLSDGKHVINITATDAMGLTTIISRNIYVDNSGPQITKIIPTSQSTVSDDVEFQVSVIDDTGIAQVFIRVDKGQWKEMQKKGEGSYSYTWNSRKAFNGKYDVDFKTIDTLGNERQGSTTVNVDNFPMLGFIIFLLGLVVLFALMVISWKKGTKPEYPAVEEEKPKEEEKPEEEEVPPPPEKATIVDLDEEKEAEESLEEEEEWTEKEDEEPPGPPPKTRSPVELYEEEMDKLAPPEPEEEY